MDIRSGVQVKVAGGGGGGEEGRRGVRGGGEGEAKAEEEGQS